VERKRQYKKIMDKEKIEWQDRNVDNIKRLLRKKDTQQLCSGIMIMTQVRKQRDGVDPVKAREYFMGLLGEWVKEWGLSKENDLPRPERRWEEELNREIKVEEIHKYLKKAKNGKGVGIDGYAMEIWKELCKRK
jgi:hypothetical protein